MRTRIYGFIEMFRTFYKHPEKIHIPENIEEFKKIFEKYSDDVYPQAYYFADLVKVAKVDFVINPASESLILSPEVFKGQ